MNIEQARFNMVEQQVRPWKVIDEDIRDLLEIAPRDAFVAEPYRNLAYADIMAPLGHGEVMMQPRIEAMMLQALQLDSSDRVLEIGTGSGYMTYLLASLSGHVISLEINEDFSAQATKKLQSQSTFNVTLECADGLQGRAVGAPYDVIAVTGSLPEVNSILKNQLSIGGKMFVIVGQAPVMEAQLIQRIGEQQWRSETLFETVLPPLRGDFPKPQFIF